LNFTEKTGIGLTKPIPSVIITIQSYTQKGNVMKLLSSLVLSLFLVGCGTVKGTVGGFLEGAGQDFKNAGEWVKN